MGTLMDKLNATNATKEQIRQAIERKKVTIPTSTPLKDYPAKIDGIYPDALFLKKDGKLGELTWSVSSWGPVKYANGYYLMLSSNNDERIALQGTDKTGWIKVQYPPISHYTEVYVLNNKFMIFDAGKVIESTDGKTWRQVGTYPKECDFKHVFERNGALVAVNAKYHSGPRYDILEFYISKNGGKTWSSDPNYPTHNTEIDHSCSYCTYVNGRFFYLATGNYAYQYLKTTTDFKKWVFCTSSVSDSVGDDPFQNLQMITYGNGVYAGIRGNKCVFSKDGIDWKFASKNAPNVQNTSHIVFNNGCFVCGGTYSNDHRNQVGVSVDGKNWYGVVVDSKNSHDFNTLSVANNVFFLTSKVNRKSYPELKAVMFYGYDYYAWSKTLSISLNDVNGTSKLNDLLSEFRPHKLDLVQTATLNAAYQAGVNSI